MAEVDGKNLGNIPKTSGGEGGHGLTIIRKKISDLHADPANANKHPENNLRAIADSLHAFGQVEPLIVQKGTGKVIGGNGRLEVLRKSGAQEVDVVELDIDGTKATALAIALNRTAKTSEFDDEILASLLQSLPDDAKLAAGFTDEDLKGLLDGLTPPIVTEDEAPEPLPDPVTRTGDLWLLGDHRLLCGDSTKAGDVEAVMNGETPFIMVTDPPYGVEYVSDKGAVTNDDRFDWTDAYKLFTGSVAYVWHGDRSAIDVGVNLRQAGFDIRACIVWAKPSLVMSRGHYHFQHEAAWYAVRKGRTSGWCGDTKQSTVWSIQREDHAHPTVKPIECMARPIRNHGGPEDRVYEPFSGSGTTIIACEQLRRKCRAIEIAPVYVDVAVRRWEKLTGKQATLKATGKTWADTAAERGVSVV